MTRQTILKTGVAASLSLAAVALLGAGRSPASVWQSGEPYNARCPAPRGSPE
jgi:hypothetical protein